jgi:hypothetical protein
MTFNPFALTLVMLRPSAAVLYAIGFICLLALVLQLISTSTKDDIADAARWIHSQGTRLLQLTCVTVVICGAYLFHTNICTSGTHSKSFIVFQVFLVFEVFALPITFVELFAGETTNLIMPVHFFTLLCGKRPT